MAGLLTSASSVRRPDTSQAFKTSTADAGPAFEIERNLSSFKDRVCSRPDAR
jgi:hypothetical protein